MECLELDSDVTCLNQFFSTAIAVIARDNWTELYMTFEARAVLVALRWHMQQAFNLLHMKLILLLFIRLFAVCRLSYYRKLIL